MKTVLTFLFALGLSMSTFASDADAAIIDAPVDPADYLTLGGDDWAWAGPCAPFAPSCGEIDLSFQAGQGWALASTAQLDAVIALVGSLTDFVAGFEAGDVCASRFFSYSYSHCDYNDGYAGRIFNYSGSAVAGSLDETFVVRVAAVPVPAAGLLLLAGLGGLGLMRRRAA